MKLPKVALVSLRGVEGCGITSWVRQFYAYYESVEEVCDFYALNDRVGRPDTSEDMKVFMFGSDEFEDVASKINQSYDLMMLMGVPSKKSKHADTYVPNFLEKIKITKVMVNHDHHFQSINRNANFVEAIEACDIVCAHSLNNARSGFMNWLGRKNVKVNKFAKLYTFIHPDKYSDIINTKHSSRLKKVSSFGRAVLWKRNLLLFNIANALSERGFIVEMMGFERSIAGWSQIDIYKDSLNPFSTEAISSLGVNHTFFKNFDTLSPFQRAEHNNLLINYINNDLPYQPHEYIYCVGSLDHHLGLGQISKSAFAAHLRSFEHIGLCYGNNHEYQGLEAMLLSVPIYHRHFLETCTLPGTDVKLSAINSFVSIDDDNRHIKEGGYQVLEPEMFIDKLETIWSNPKLYQQMRTENVEIINKYYSCKALIKPFLENLV